MAGPASLLNTPRMQALRRSSAGPFPLITLIVLIVIGLLSFLGASYLEVFDDGSGEPWTDDANAFSRSAIGHRAFVATLRKLGIPVEISRFRTLDKVGAGNLLLVIEPDTGTAGQAILAHLREVPHALLVLPKWEGWPDLQKPIWIGRMNLLPEHVPADVLHSVLSSVKIARNTGTATRRSDRFGGKLELNDPQYIAPAGETNFTPLIDTPYGIVAGKLDISGNELGILSDPDLLSNSGLDDADNGVIAVSIVKMLLPPGGTVIVDETSHGFEVRPNLFRTMLRPPFVAVSIAAVLALIVLVWAGVSRFGAPQREVEALAAGKLTLIRNAAQLLRLGTTAAILLQSYRRLTLADAIAELHGPAGLDEFGQAAWLDRAARHRGLKLKVTPMLDEMAALAEANRLDAGRALRFALDLHRWKQEIMHGAITGRRAA
ncbi:MAG TPA: DUF4350 domain-containing protein [Candidatus Cybelea sp.]|nr:DUF4350 domain-containing protein [Candidatus Cybelea sp.]